MSAQYDQTKDKILLIAELDGLQLTVHQYGDEDPKIKIGPRIMKKGKEPLYLRVGRLSIAEMKWVIAQVSPFLDN